MSNDPTTKTALDLITGALRKIGQYAPGETLSAEEAQDALDTLNGMLDLWSAQNLSVYTQLETIITLTSGQATYTIGAGGDFNIVRPLRLVSAYSRVTGSGQGIDFPCQLTTLEKYSAIGFKAQPGPWPKLAYYNVDVPLGSLTMWPVPTSSVQFHLWTDEVFTSLALADVVNLPRSYFLGLQFSLAELLCSEYGISVPPDVRRFAKQFRDVIKDMNASPQSEVMMDAALVATGGNDAGWILTGGF